MFLKNVYLLSLAVLIFSEGLLYNLSKKQQSILHKQASGMIPPGISKLSETGLKTNVPNDVRGKLNLNYSIDIALRRITAYLLKKLRKEMQKQTLTFKKIFVGRKNSGKSENPSLY